MSGIGGIGTNGMQRTDPLGVFKKTDSDGSGGVSQAELKNLSDVIKEKTGKTFEVSSESFKMYDSNSDGSLSGEELKTVLDNSGFGPPQGMQGMGPPPPPPQQAGDSYSSNSYDSEQDAVSELVSNLQALLEKLSGSSSSDSSGTTQVFDPMDTNMDGKVSSSELLAALASSDNQSGQIDSGSLQDQMKELNSTLKLLSSYLESKNRGSSESLLSITT